MTNNT
jgi:hypothetical protein